MQRLCKESNHDLLGRHTEDHQHHTKCAQTWISHLVEGLEECFKSREMDQDDRFCCPVILCLEDLLKLSQKWVNSWPKKSWSNRFSPPVSYCGQHNSLQLGLCSTGETIWLLLPSEMLGLVSQCFKSQHLRVKSHAYVEKHVGLDAVCWWD